MPVRPKISGRVVEKYVQGGQEVTEGQPLFRLDSRTYDAALAQAKATQAQSEANLANQQLNLRRYRKLVKAVKKVYPVAQAAKAQMVQMEAELLRLETKKEQKQYIKGIAAAIIDEALARLDPANQSERLRTQLEKKLRLTDTKILTI